MRTIMRLRGFTTIELVAVMVIVAVLAVVVVPRLNPGGFERHAFRHEVLAALRYAQKTAMASGCEVAVELDGDNESYRVLLRGGATGPSECGGSASFGELARHPARGGDYAGAGGAGVDLQVTGRVTVAFDGFGRYLKGPTSIALEGGPNIEIDDVTGYVRG